MRLWSKPLLLWHISLRSKICKQKTSTPAVRLDQLNDWSLLLGKGVLDDVGHHFNHGLELIVSEFHEFFVLFVDVFVDFRGLFVYDNRLFAFILSIGHTFGDKEAFVRVLVEFEQESESILKVGNLDNFFFVATGDLRGVNFSKSITCNGNNSVEEHYYVDNSREEEDEPL